MMVPNRDECINMLKDRGIPENIINHSIAVADVALELGRKIKSNGEGVDLKLLEAAALLHDISKHEGIAGKFEEVSHGIAGAELLRRMGLAEVADVVEVHTMSAILKPGKLDTWEKKLVYYADKRVNHDKRVTFDERLDYLINRYPRGAEEFRKEEPLIRALEKEIFEKAGVSE